MLSQEREEFVKEMVGSGVFVRTKARCWTATVTRKIELPPSEMSEFPAGRTEYTHQLKIPQLRQCGFVKNRHALAVKCFCFHTPYGYFVPDCNVKLFVEEMSKIQHEVESLRDEIVAGYGNVKESLATEYRKVAESLWKNKYGHEGNPTVNFCDRLTEKYLATIPSQTEVAGRFGLDIMPLNPMIDPQGPHAVEFGAEEHNIRVLRSVYDAILYKRRALAAVASKAIVRFDEWAIDRVYKNLFVKLSAYRDTIFYDDPELLRLIDAIRDLAIVYSPNRTREAGEALLTGVVDHIKNHDFFIVGEMS